MFGTIGKIETLMERLDLQSRVIMELKAQLDDLKTQDKEYKIKHVCERYIKDDLDRPYGLLADRDSVREMVLSLGRLAGQLIPAKYALGDRVKFEQRDDYLVIEVSDPIFRDGSWSRRYYLKSSSFPDVDASESEIKLVKKGY